MEAMGPTYPIQNKEDFLFTFNLLTATIQSTTNQHIPETKPSRMPNDGGHLNSHSYANKTAVSNQSLTTCVPSTSTQYMKKLKR